jgi:acyl-CoA dehydrogenase
VPSADPTSEDKFERLLAEAVLHAPSFSIRGGTREILRGIIARDLGLR